MNDDLKIKDFREDKRKIEEEISIFITKKLVDFMIKYDVEDLDISVESYKHYTEQSQKLANIIIDPKIMITL